MAPHATAPPRFSLSLFVATHQTAAAPRRPAGWRCSPPPRAGHGRRLDSPLLYLGGQPDGAVSHRFRVHHGVRAPSPSRAATTLACRRRVSCCRLVCRCPHAWRSDGGRPRAWAPPAASPSATEPSAPPPPRPFCCRSTPTVPPRRVPDCGHLEGACRKPPWPPLGPFGARLARAVPPALPYRVVQGWWSRCCMHASPLAWALPLRVRWHAPLPCYAYVPCVVNSSQYPCRRLRFDELRALSYYVSCGAADY